MAFEYFLGVSTVLNGGSHVWQSLFFCRVVRSEDCLMTISSLSTLIFCHVNYFVWVGSGHQLPVKCRCFYVSCRFCSDLMLLLIF